MTTTEEQRLVEAAVAARESATVGWPGSVDDVVAGGRRRRAAVLVPALGLTLAAGGLALELLGGGRADVQPALPVTTSGPSTSATSPPTTSTTTSSPTDRATSTPFVGVGRVHLATAVSALDGFPEGTVYFTTADMTYATDVSQPPDPIVFPPQVEIYVAAKGRATTSGAPNRRPRPTGRGSGGWRSGRGSMPVSPRATGAAPGVSSRGRVMVRSIS